jgi:hypothetical protein
MAYFITSSASASVVQTILDSTGSVITSSLYTPNDPINVDNIVYIQKNNSQFPNLSRSVYKPSLSFLYNGQSVSWLYDDDSIRDSDYNLIKTLNTNYDGKGGGGTTDTGSLLLTASVSSNTITFTKGNGSTFPITVDTGSGGGGGITFPYSGSAIITGSLIVTGSSVLSGSVTLNNITWPTVEGDNGDIIYTNGAGVLTFDKTKVYAPVKNVSGGTLFKGTPVHASSSVGNTNEVIAASASVASTMPATFVLAQNLAVGEEGLGIVTGFLNGVNTSAFKEGQIVYVGANGGYTNIKPSGSNLIQNLGIVTKVAVNGSGYIYGAGRSNDTPNLLHNQIFFGSGSNQQYQIHISGALNSTVINNITASGNISASAFIGDGSQLTGIAAASFPYTGSAIITGSLIVTGSVNGFVSALTIASSTASMDLSRGNFFTLTLASGSNTHLSPTNIRPGQTINLIITQPATSGSLSYSSTLKFPGGIPYSASATGSVVDILSMVSFDSSTLYATAIKNLS